MAHTASAMHINELWHLFIE